MGKVRGFSRGDFDAQEGGLRSALAAVARCDPHEVADSYVRRVGGQAYVTARREGASAEVLRLIRDQLRKRRKG